MKRTEALEKHLQDKKVDKRVIDTLFGTLYYLAGHDQTNTPTDHVLEAALEQAWIDLGEDAV